MAEAPNVNNLNGIPNFGHGVDEAQEVSPQPVEAPEVTDAPADAEEWVEINNQQDN